MADKEAAGGKFVMKPGTHCLDPYLTDFQLSLNGEHFIYATLEMPSKEIETLNKTIDEVKEIYNCHLGGNNIADPSCLKELQNLRHLELQRNKIKNVAIFCLEDAFTNLLYLDLSNNKFNELCNFALPKLEYLDISHNKLEKVNEAWVGHPNLRVLNVADNKFKNLAPFKNCPKLVELYA
jgi:Leucine-rich repeat (LRR) protein